MPMSFAVILGGLVTIIGTSTNLVIQGDIVLLCLDSVVSLICVFFF